MLVSMFVFRRVTAPYVTARKTQANFYPRIPYFYTLFAPQ